MSKTIEVVVTRIQITTVEVPDDFDTTGDLTRELSDAAWDTIDAGNIDDTFTVNVAAKTVTPDSPRVMTTIITIDNADRDTEVDRPWTANIRNEDGDLLADPGLGRARRAALIHLLENTDHEFPNFGENE